MNYTVALRVVAHLTMLLGFPATSTKTMLALAADPCLEQLNVGCLQYRVGDDLITGMQLLDYSSARSTISLSLFFHFIAAENGTSFGPANIPGILTGLNATYKFHGISFHSVGSDSHAHGA
jgi:hypothetical protein